ncbi:helix-turn-helix domain-containing protein [Gracilimonas mengyeensis]|uniref:TolB amino-terminal domain-containing protein n=1 Tax=Gracilimonas mengyeensis TaxID=1302730 RepID=A0A521D114_9BACT|nr:helix-turn-helix domain-containing protein [Gracilimonas mengyeensis]SMO65368.1 TolB amino-terminal domain-containing protein [Gracilimonas mengyeensis]
MNSKSIAVLRFLNLSPEPDDEYFSDGITEEIILSLSKIEGLKVTARTSSFAFKNQGVDIRDIGKALGVSTVLEGSIRRAGQKVRISVQLVRTDNGFQIWSDKFDRKLEDIFDLQEEISLLVADKIRENFGHIELQSSLHDEPMSSIDAYDYYLKGRYEQLKWNNDALHRAIKLYKKAIQLDPENSRAYYGIVQCYIYLVFWSSEEKDVDGVYEYLYKAAAVNDQTSEYFLAKASAEIMIEWDYEYAVKHFRQLLQLNPNHTEALEAVAGLYIMVGQFREALIHIDRALELNPLSLNHTFMKGNILYFSGEYERAIQQMDKVLRQDPKWMFAVQLKAASLILLNKKNELEELLDGYADYPFMVHYQTLNKLYHGVPVSDYPIPSLADETIHAWQLYFLTLEENYEQAFEMLEHGLEKKHGKFMCFDCDPFLVKLQDQAGFENLSRFIPGALPLLSDVYKESAGPRPLITDEEERAELLVALDESMYEQQVFLNPDLSLSSLADHLNTSSNKLSWLINEDKEMNFNDFINSHRLEYFQDIALDPSNQNLTLLGIAFESGFNSKSTFNDYFKKKTGTTPRAWLKQQK